MVEYLEKNETIRWWYLCELRAVYVLQEKRGKVSLIVYYGRYKTNSVIGLVNWGE